MQATAPKGRLSVTDGDDAFTKVDTHRAPGQLQPTEVAAATNQRFEFGEAWPRLGVAKQAWGATAADMVDGDSLFALAVSGPPDVYYAVQTVTGFVVGQTYIWTKSTADTLSTGLTGSYTASGTVLTESQSFIATATTYYLIKTAASSWSSSGFYWQDTITLGNSPLAFQRFNDPDGVDTLVLCTDEWRTSTDGGRGRAWRVQSGATPTEIPLNGHDVYGTTRLVQAYNGLLAFRHGNERHYFIDSDVNTTTDVITLHCVPSWNIGDLVTFNLASDEATLVGSSSPNVGAPYYVGDNGATSTAIAASVTAVTLHTTRSGALANTGKLNYSAALGKFYLERAATNPGYFGNGAPPLLMQPNATQTCFEAGFAALDTTARITATNTATTVVAVNHRFIPGDAVVFGTTTYFTAGTKYVRPLNDNEFTVHATQDEALANSGAIAASASGTDAVQKVGASALPLPSAKEAIYYKNRIVALGDKNVTIGDVLDPLRCTPFMNTLPTNQGESDRPVTITPLSQDAVLILKENSIVALTGLAGDSSGWAEQSITREYGCAAALTSIIVGADVWLLSRRGIMSVTQTAQGILQGVTESVSRAMKRYLERVDWANAGGACAGTWDNRYFIALPTKGQTGLIKNDMVLVYNFLNQGWEGMWEGDDLEVYAFARHQVYGEERLCFVDYSGQVCYLHEAWTDSNNLAIATSLTTREYWNNQRVLTTRVDLNWDTQAPAITVQTQSPGYNELTTLRSGITYDATRYTRFGAGTYDAATSTETTYAVANREDYSTTPQELLVGNPDAHQNMQERATARVDDVGCQVIISNASGSARLKNLQLQGTTKPRSHKRRT
jgi:hypothetical protein